MNNRIFMLALLIAAMGEPSLAAPPKLNLEPVSGIEFVRIPGGCFQMGAAAAGSPQPGQFIAVPGPDELPRHEVCLKSFWMARSEVTRAQWSRVTEQVLHGVDRPVAEVDWHAASAFARQLAEKTGRTIRLPTEAEWEYACHAGEYRPASQPIGEERFRLLEETAELAWYRYHSGRNPQVHAVMSRRPNAWGLHDMLGNLWEWTADGYDQSAYARHAKDAPFQPPTDLGRVMRGGSYKSDLAKVRCGARSYAPAEERMNTIGFRVVMETGPDDER